MLTFILFIKKIWKVSKQTHNYFPKGLKKHKRLLFPIVSTFSYHIMVIISKVKKAISSFCGQCLIAPYRESIYFRRLLHLSGRINLFIAGKKKWTGKDNRQAARYLILPGTQSGFLQRMQYDYCIWRHSNYEVLSQREGIKLLGRNIDTKFKRGIDLSRARSLTRHQLYSWAGPPKYIPLTQAILPNLLTWLSLRAWGGPPPPPGRGGGGGGGAGAPLTPPPGRGWGGGGAAGTQIQPGQEIGQDCLC